MKLSPCWRQWLLYLYLVYGTHLVIVYLGAKTIASSYKEQKKAHKRNIHTHTLHVLIQLPLGGNYLIAFNTFLETHFLETHFLLSFNIMIYMMHVNICIYIYYKTFIDMHAYVYQIKNTFLINVCSL